jgi:prophage tail gpP-like protein
MANTHVIRAIVEGQEVGDFESGSVESSIITPADKFVLRMPYSQTADRTFRRDAHITILADGVVLIDGFVDKRKKLSSRGMGAKFEVSGRDRVGRLVDESAPAVSYDGMTVLEAVRRLASPWFSPDQVVIDNARNRRVRRGKGRRVAAPAEPVVTFNVRVPRRGQVHPGETRWHLIHEILSRAGMVGWSSSDGRELFIGVANQEQAPQYLFVQGGPDSRLQTTVREMTWEEDDGDRYSLYLCAGVGGQGDTNFGPNVTDQRGRAFDNPFDKIDGTGRDFIHPKRMFLPERAYDSFADATRVAELEMKRRDMKRHTMSVEMDTFGQDLGSGEPTLFTTDTIGHVIDEEAGIDDLYYLISCTYSFVRQGGETTLIHMVPQGTEIVI